MGGQIKEPRPVCPKGRGSCTRDATPESPNHHRPTWLPEIKEEHQLTRPNGPYSERQPLIL